jgi:hypothetical protein
LRSATGTSNAPKHLSVKNTTDSGGGVEGNPLAPDGFFDIVPFAPVVLGEMLD